MSVYKSKNPTKDGRQYFFRIKYKDIFGKTIDYSSEKFKYKKEAEEAEALKRIELSKNKTNSCSITLKEAFLEYHALHIENIKKQCVKIDINLFKYLKPIENKKINDLTIQDYNKLKLELKELNYSIKFKNNILGLLKRIIKYSKKYYNTSDNLLNFIENFKKVNEIEKEMNFFTLDEYKKFDSVIENFMHHTFFELLFYMGLRQGECQALTWNDIDLENCTLKVTKTLTTKIKGQKWLISSPKTKTSIRTLPLTKKLVEDLNKLKIEAQKYKDFSNNWFVFGNSMPFPETTIQVNKNKYCKMAEIKQIRIHDFRHSCASLLINQGASIVLVSKWLGHSNTAITLNTYTHLYKSELNEMVNILNKL